VVAKSFKVMRNIELAARLVFFHLTMSGKLGGFIS